MRNYVFLTALIALLIMQTFSTATPVYSSDFLGTFGNDQNSNEYRGTNSRRGYSTRYTGSSYGQDRIYRSRFNSRRPAEKPRGRTYNEICRVYTPVNYLKTGVVSVPFCPNT